MKWRHSTDKALLDARDSDGSTALQCAIWKGHRDVVVFLLAAGADVQVQNNNDHWGTTPLHAAAHANQREIVQLLLDAGADVHAKDMHGFHTATAAAKVLREHGGG